MDNQEEINKNTSSFLTEAEINEMIAQILEKNRVEAESFENGTVIPNIIPTADINMNNKVHPVNNSANTIGAITDKGKQKFKFFDINIKAVVATYLGKKFLKIAQTLLSKEAFQKYQENNANKKLEQENIAKAEANLANDEPVAQKISTDTPLADTVVPIESDITVAEEHPSNITSVLKTMVENKKNDIVSNIQSKINNKKLTWEEQVLRRKITYLEIGDRIRTLTGQTPKDPLYSGPKSTKYLFYHVFNFEGKKQSNENLEAKINSYKQRLGLISGPVPQVAPVEPKQAVDNAIYYKEDPNNNFVETPAEPLKTL